MTHQKEKNFGKIGQKKMDSKNEIEGWFPNIIGNPYKIIKTLTFEVDEFNCIAFTLEVYSTFIWTNEKSWPYDKIPRNSGIPGFKLLYELYDYEECFSLDYEIGYNKIVFYSKNGLPKHAAKQFGNNWRSKTGKYIIEHQPEWLCGDSEYAYGKIDFIMKKKI